MNRCSKSTSVLAFLPISRGYNIVHVRCWSVSAAARLTQAVGPCLAEYEPVSDVELGQQTVLHYLVHVIPGGTPQTAAEHGSIQARVLQTQTGDAKAELLQESVHFKIDLLIRNLVLLW